MYEFLDAFNVTMGDSCSDEHLAQHLWSNYLTDRPQYVLTNVRGDYQAMVKRLKQEYGGGK